MKACTYCFGKSKVFAIARLQRLFLLFMVTLAIACCSHTQLRSADANLSAYRYLAQIADRPNSATDTVKLLAKNDLRLLASYETNQSTRDFDRVLDGVAFTYDTAVSALAFIAVGDRQRAKQLVDAIAYDQNHDRF